MKMTVTVDRVFKASPEKLYEVWTNAEFLSQWFGVKVDADPKVGGVIRFHFGEEGGPVHGKYQTLNPYDHVALTWTSNGANKEPDTIVHVHFQKEQNGTRMTLRHEGFTDQKSFDAHDEGWLSYMELWSVRLNAGPADAKKASISETFPASSDLMAAIAQWLELPPAQLHVTKQLDGTQVIQSDSFEAHISVCRFGFCLAICEWGFQDEPQRLAARQKWLQRFATLKKSSG